MKYLFFVLLLANVLLLLWEINTGALYQELDAEPVLQETEGIGQIRLLSEISADDSREVLIALKDKTAQQETLPPALVEEAQDAALAEPSGPLAMQAVKPVQSSAVDMPEETGSPVQKEGKASPAGVQSAMTASEKVGPGEVKPANSSDQQFQNDTNAGVAGTGSAESEYNPPAAASKLQTQATMTEAPRNIVESGLQQRSDKPLTDDVLAGAPAGEPAVGRDTQAAGISGDAMPVQDPGSDDQTVEKSGGKQDKSIAVPEVKPALQTDTSGTVASVGTSAGDLVLDELVCHEIGPFGDTEMLQAGTAEIAALADHAESFSIGKKIPRGYVILYPAAETFEQSLDNYQRLKKQGYSDLWLFRKTAWRGAVSMGIYSNENRAKRIAQRLIDKGMNDPDQTDLQESPAAFSQGNDGKVQAAILAKNRCRTGKAGARPAIAGGVDERLQQPKHSPIMGFELLLG